MREAGSIFEPEHSEHADHSVPYRTRSGRAVRQVPRYEPDENTIFVDGESNGSEFNLSGEDGEDEDSSEVDDDEVDNDSSDTSEPCSDIDLETDLETDVESELDDLLDDESLDWDRLTDDASNDEDTEDDGYDDVDEEIYNL